MSGPAASVAGGRAAGTSVPSRRSLNSSLDVLSTQLWLRPTALLQGAAAEAAIAAQRAQPLAGGSGAFALVELLGRRRSGEIVAALGTLAELRRWGEERGEETAARIEAQLTQLSERRSPWAGLPLDRPLLMGILNVTPDSFSDGGDFLDPERAIGQGRAMQAAGADIIDVGGESTRPGALPVAPEEELRRIEPVVRALASAGLVVSVDTRHARTMAAAIAAGARIVNDVTALAGDPQSIATVARAEIAVVLMHMQGEPRTMQVNPEYHLPSLEIVEHLAARLEACLAAGIPHERVVVDPGIGFGKAAAHNLEIMSRLSLFHALGCGVLLGISRKSLIGTLHKTAPKERLPGSIAGALHAVAQGVQILRVHDIAETKQAVASWQAMAAGDRSRG